jgi:hypothetical protein
MPVVKRRSTQIKQLHPINYGVIWSSNEGSV